LEKRSSISHLTVLGHMEQKEVLEELFDAYAIMKKFKVI
jgi:hypothetical protein